MEDVAPRRNSEVRQSVDEWERHIGEQVRNIRLAKNISQARLAHLAAVSPGTIHNLESGSGSSLSTLIKVLRALDAEEWLVQLQPPAPSFDPVAVFAHRQREKRARRRHASPSSTN